MQKTFIIKNPTGLHARPAAELVKKASLFPCTVSLIKNEKKVNAKSIISVLSLGVSQNEQVIVAAEGEQAAEALQAVTSFFESLVE